MFTTITTQSNQLISRITLNRPKVCNAFNALMIQELQNALHQIAVDDAVRVLLLDANGQHFCAGADLNWMQQSAALNSEENYQDAWQLTLLLETLANFPKPTIATVQGKAIGGGCGLLACCDIAIASKNACFGFSEIQWGLIPATIAPYIIRRTSYQTAKYHFITANPITATQALKLQLVDELVDEKALADRASCLSQQLAAYPPNTSKNIKSALNRLVPIPRAVLIDSTDQLAKQRHSSEAQEALQAFIEKRSPNWTTITK